MREKIIEYVALCAEVGHSQALRIFGKDFDIDGENVVDIIGNMFDAGRITKKQFRSLTGQQLMFILIGEYLGRRLPDEGDIVYDENGVSREEMNVNNIYAKYQEKIAEAKKQLEAARKK